MSVPSRALPRCARTEKAEIEWQLVLRDAPVRSQPGAQQRPKAFLKECPVPAVPEHAYFIGPTIMEDWSGIDLSEMFSFSVGVQDGTALRRLMGCCLALPRG